MHSWLNTISRGKFSIAKRKVFLLSVVLMCFSSCSTRQIVNELEGSTEQRLATHSVDKLISELPNKPLNQIQDKTVFLQSHFLNEHPILNYATERLKTELEWRYKVQWQEESQAQYTINVFFTSLGTDEDSTGLSLPLPVQGEDTDVSRIDIFSIDMYHGVSELYMYLANNENKEMIRMNKQKARIRTDRLSLPFISIPINSID